ncbi:RidA family protein [Persicitalea jodogahamensis]|uniref:Reactive intermediate/imine deaminase n=1 Tax=Persicitalea jodogahamensis TaxID=402147 RepID=A0A8J3DCL2_9BACT|nr:Rid family detoxifying hydrolase [Persicitalea jodogahamensis]GHB83963.1 reactive intermediate/imine deaminase [Persicitalea jodogahamensis]
MEKQRVTHPQRDPDFSTGAYSDGVVCGDLLFVSGQAAVDFANNTFKLGTIEEETRLTLENIKAIASQVGLTLDDVLKCTVHLADINDFARYNEVYASYFTGIKPARTTVQSVLAEGLKVEIDAIFTMPAK